jgi:hypothetical protein
MNEELNQQPDLTPSIPAAAPVPTVDSTPAVAPSAYAPPLAPSPVELERAAALLQGAGYGVHELPEEPPAYGGYQPPAYQPPYQPGSYSPGPQSYGQYGQPDQSSPDDLMTRAEFERYMQESLARTGQQSYQRAVQKITNDGIVDRAIADAGLPHDEAHLLAQRFKSLPPDAQSKVVQGGMFRDAVDAAKFRAQQRGVTSQIPGAAPVGLPAPTGNVRGQLSQSQAADLAENERQFGVTYSDADIREFYGL